MRRGKCQEYLENSDRNVKCTCTCKLHACACHILCYCSNGCEYARLINALISCGMQDTSIIFNPLILYSNLLTTMHRVCIHWSGEVGPTTTQSTFTTARGKFTTTTERKVLIMPHFNHHSAHPGQNYTQNVCRILGYSKKH